VVAKKVVAGNVSASPKSEKSDLDSNSLIKEERNEKEHRCTCSCLIRTCFGWL
jgi:hypothetical protein